MNYIEIKAPAKINIGLWITSRRDDGYHNIETLFYPLNNLYDVLTFTKSERFSFSSSDTSLNTPDNLVIKAAELLSRYCTTSFNVEIKLEKKIPMGAGLGGGSSDAAAVLISLNDMFKLNLNFDQLRELALEIGSDVPFFIKPYPSFARSRGENLHVTDIEINYPILIINPGIHISTKEAYKNVTPSERNIHIEDLRNILVNDFENYVFSVHPEIKNIKETLYEQGALFALMSGSGSTVYGIFPDLLKAEECRVLFPAHYFTFINYNDSEI